MKIIKVLVLTVLILLPFGQQKVLAADYYSIIYTEVSNFNSNPSEIDWTVRAILYASTTYSVDPLLLTALLEQESGFSLSAESNKGAIGMAQLMPGTAEMIGVDPYDPLQNIMGGASYLKTQIDNFQSWGEYGITYAIAAYNAGPGAVYEYNGVPPYAETVNYVRSIAAIFEKLNAYR